MWRSLSACPSYSASIPVARRWASPSRPACSPEPTRPWWGALYLECGEDAAFAFVRATLAEPLQLVLQNPAAKHPKSRLQEALQAQSRKKPEYRQLASETESVSVEVLCDGETLGMGTGRALRAAERAAAEDALLRLTGL